MRDPYSVLGVPKSASQKDIKSAFRKLAKQYHPDRNKDDTSAQASFAKINQAYEIVGDKDKRRQFDRGEIDGKGQQKHPGFEGFGGQNPFEGFQQRGGTRTRGNPFAGAGFEGAEDVLNELFGSAFGGQAQAGRTRQYQALQQRGAPSLDVEMKASVELDDLMRGKVAVRMPDGKQGSISIPPEAKDGQVIRLKGKGKSVPGRKPGDALVTLVFRTGGRFEAKGVDLHSDVMLPLETAVNGGKIAVETLDGKISLAIPPWTTSGKIFRLKGRGLPTKTKGMGDFLVRVMIELPDEGDKKLMEFFGKK